MDVLAHMAERGLKNHIRLFTYQPVHVSNIEQLAGLGLQTTLLPHADAVPPLVPGDVVVLNTTGFTPNVKNAIFSALERGVVKKLFWYVHEDLPERIFSAAETAMIRRLSAEDKVVVSTQSRRACRRYARHFGMEILLEPASRRPAREVPPRPRCRRLRDAPLHHARHVPRRPQGAAHHPLCPGDLLPAILRARNGRPIASSP